MHLGALKEFQSCYEKPILEGQKYNSTKRQLALSRQSTSCIDFYHTFIMSVNLINEHLQRCLLIKVPQTMHGIIASLLYSLSHY